MDPRCPLTVPHARWLSRLKRWWSVTTTESTTRTRISASIVTTKRPQLKNLRLICKSTLTPHLNVAIVRRCSSQSRHWWLTRGSIRERGLTSVTCAETVSSHLRFWWLIDKGCTRYLDPNLRKMKTGFGGKNDKSYVRWVMSWCTTLTPHLNIATVRRCSRQRRHW